MLSNVSKKKKDKHPMTSLICGIQRQMDIQNILID